MLDAIQLVTGVAWWAVGQETGIGHNIKPVPQPYKLKFAYLIGVAKVERYTIFQGLRVYQTTITSVHPSGLPHEKKNKAYLINSAIS